jgi:hypothetical protein
MIYCPHEPSCLPPENILKITSSESAFPAISHNNFVKVTSMCLLPDDRQMSEKLVKFLCDDYSIVQIYNVKSVEPSKLFQI